MAGLWTRSYFLRQAAKVGPSTAAAIERLLDGKAIEAQGYRSCMNILDLGKRASTNRVLLEQACRGLLEEDPNRPVTYTSVKHRMSVLRADSNQRPTTSSGDETMPTPRPDGAGAAGRDTSRAHLAGTKAFSLDALTAGPPAGDRRDGDPGTDTEAGGRR
ncbi:MAG: hypothetical protein K0U67_04005 [Actinomycetia bacterium]|nr:hypothetical protein [Actinomycetes bacterium]